MEEFVGVVADKALIMGQIQRRHLSSALTVVPPTDVCSQVDAIVSPLIDHYIQTRLEFRTIAETRDVLLPKPISGEVRVGDLR